MSSAERSRSARDTGFLFQMKAADVFKILLLFYNLLFVIVSFLLLPVFALMLWNFGKSNLVHYPEVPFSFPATMLLLIIMVAFFGVYGAFTESRMLLAMFSMFMVMLCLPTLIGSILTLFRLLYHESYVQDALNILFLMGDTKMARLTWRVVQNTLKCCGVHNMTNELALGKGHSESCQCLHEDEYCVNGFYKRGCYEVIGDWTAFLKEEMPFMAIALTSMLILGVIIALALLWMVNKEKESKQKKIDKEKKKAIKETLNET